MNFLVKNFIYIILLSILIIGSLAIFSIFNDKFRDVPPGNYQNLSNNIYIKIIIIIKEWCK